MSHVFRQRNLHVYTEAVGERPLRPHHLLAVQLALPFGVSSRVVIPQVAKRGLQQLVAPLLHPRQQLGLTHHPCHAAAQGISVLAQRDRSPCRGIGATRRYAMGEGDERGPGVGRNGLGRNGLGRNGLGT